MTGRDRLAWLVLTFAGSGASPVAPGTAGSFAAVGVVAILWWSGLTQLWLLPALALAMAVLHVAVGDRIAPVFGKEDPGAVVSDEVCGQWIALSIPLAAETPREWVLLLGFLLFRVFDVTKWLGVGRLEKIPGKWGVLLDDVLAGIYAGLVLWGLAASGVLDSWPSFVP